VSAALLLTGLGITLPAPAASKTWRINNIAPSARIHLRQRPSNQSKVLAYIPGETGGLRAGACVEDWCEVEYRGLKGWIFRDYLEEDDEPQAKPEQQALPEPQSQMPVVAAPASTRPEDLERLTSFRLIGRGEGTIPVYSFPSETLPVAGRLPGTTQSVDGLGTCVPNWCYIRAGSLIGWIKYEELNFGGAPQSVEATASVAPASPAEERNTINKTVPTATNATAPAPDAAPSASFNGSKSYALAGLAGNSLLPLRAEPEEGARILDWIPNDAKNVEGMRKCVEQWCLVRYRATEGWVARRHLADISVEETQTFQVSGLSLWDPLKVLDQPSGDANVVGEIPSYATGIVPIGGCDRTWCHIRYLGIAGWVNSEHLEPQRR
jgi:SH3-like domain-containing protein